MDFKETLTPAAETLQGWGEKLLSLAPNIIVAFVVLFFAWLVARFGRSIAERMAKRASARNAVARLLGTVTMLMILFAGLFIALGVLGLNKTAASVAAGAGVLGLAMGLAAQSLAASLMAGTMISIQKPYAEGDLIEIGDQFGVVERIDLRITTLQTLQGQMVMIPNKEIFDQPVVNYTRLGRRRVDLAVGVPYGEDLERAAEIAVTAVRGISGLLEEREVELFYEQFGGSSIDFQIRFWIPFRQQLEYLEARSQAVMRIKAAFDEHDITIPFPIRTLDFGIKGGLPLAEVLDAQSSG